MIHTKEIEKKDLKSDKLRALGRAVYDFFHEHTVIEDASWARQRIARVLLRLQSVRMEKKRFRVTVPWIQMQTAFTLPGRHIFVSRNLFQLCRNDDQFAFIVAHEMAHHDLQHVVGVLPAWLDQVLNDKLHAVFWLARQSFVKEKTRHLQEFEADEYALRLCVKAGFDPVKCLSIFGVLEHILLDRRAISSIFGEESGETWEEQVKQKMFSGVKTHPPLRARREALQAILDHQINAVPRPRKAKG